MRSILWHGRRRGLELVGFAIAISAAVGCDSPRRADPPASSYTKTGIQIEVNGSWRGVGAATVGPQFFETDIRPLLGRPLLPVEHDSTAPVAMLAEQFWRDVFAEDPAVIGRKIKTDGTPGGSLTIVGVMPRSFGAPQGIGLWLPRRDSTRQP
jgi:hypothetical protein